MKDIFHINMRVKCGVNLYIYLHSGNSGKFDFQIELKSQN